MKGSIISKIVAIILVVVVILIILMVLWPSVVAGIHESQTDYANNVINQMKKEYPNILVAPLFDAFGGHNPKPIYFKTPPELHFNALGSYTQSKVMANTYLFNT